MSGASKTAPRLLVVIPAHNEQDTVAEVVKGALNALDCDVLVANDCSSDETHGRARAAGATVLDMAIQLGAWGAVQTGMRYAQRNGYSHVLTMDADGQHHASDLPHLLETQQRGSANVVIGSCEPRLSTAKRLAWRYFRALTGIRVRDFTSGLRVYDARAIALLAGPPASLLDYQDIGVLMLLDSQGLGIEETAITMSPRSIGISRVFSSWWMVMRYMIATTVLCISRFERSRTSP